MNNRKSDRLLRWATALLTFALTFAVLYALYWRKGLEPFGTRTLMVDDAEWQYLDFFSYLKDVLAGRNSINYTFSKGLGGGGIALFAYYLASPLNLLVVFFDTNDLHAFFALLCALKLALAGAFFAWFLMSRFYRRGFDLCRAAVVALLSLSYALGQYSIAQSRNIMWLDGLYMLPLIMLGTWHVIRGGKLWRLATPVALAILFNWYSAGADCVFSIIYFFFELFLEARESGRDRRFALVALMRYGLAMALGVVISAGLFFPTVFALSGTSKGTLTLKSLLDMSLIGNPAESLLRFIPGGSSTYGTVSLCCGSLALIGCVALFMLKSMPAWRKVTYAAMAIVGLAMFHWSPLVMVFSLLKHFDSYWYRYSYVGIALVVYLAAAFFADEGTPGREKAIIALKAALLILALGFAGSLVQEKLIDRIDAALRWFVLAAAGMTILLCWNDRKGARRALAALLCLAAVTPDIAFNAALVMEKSSEEFAESYENYSPTNRQQLAALKQADEGPYRLVQTYTRRMHNQNTAMYNEPIGYGFWSNVIYASTVDQPPMTFMDKLGYPAWADTLNVANTCQLPADSLISAKYVLSRYPINGLEPTDLPEGVNGKRIYLNPFCLPFAFTYANEGGLIEAENPFEYQNAIYSRLLGEDARIFVPLAFTSTPYDELAGTLYSYTVSIPEGRYAVYGNLPYGKQYRGYLDLNGRERSYYAAWLCPDVFYIPTDFGDTQAYVTITTEQPERVETGNEQFYAVDLDAFARVSAALRDRGAAEIAVENGSAAFTVSAAGEGERLFVSIPYDKGWTVRRNGEVLSIDPEKDVFEACMFAIPLTAGENVIQMTYRTPHLTLFMLISLMGVAVLALIDGAPALLKRRKRA